MKTKEEVLDWLYKSWLLDKFVHGKYDQASWDEFAPDIADIIIEYATQLLPSEEEIIQVIDQFHQPLDITGLSYDEVDQMEHEYDKFAASLAQAILSLIKGE